jgi:hypothetical protein
MKVRSPQALPIESRDTDAVLAHPTMAEGLGMLFSNVPLRSVQSMTPERVA